jgi:hypothetical protein
VFSKSASLDLIPVSQIDVAIKQGKLINLGKLILSRAVNCTEPGIFPIECTNYKLCYATEEGYLGAEGTCAPENFNPFTLMCDSNYDCPQCTKAGFTCPSNSTFTYCSDALEVITYNVTCPTDHFCNKVCQHPCTKFLQNC